MDIEPRNNSIKVIQMKESLMPYENKSSSTFQQHSTDNLDFLKMENTNIKLED
jgi:hypothetical protein